MNRLGVRLTAVLPVVLVVMALEYHWPLWFALLVAVGVAGTLVLAAYLLLLLRWVWVTLQAGIKHRQGLQRDYDVLKAEYDDLKATWDGMVAEAKERAARLQGGEPSIHLHRDD